MIMIRARFLFRLFCAFWLSFPSAFADDAYPQRSQDEVIVETVLRLDGFDLNSSAKAKSAVLRYGRHNAGSGRFFELVRRYPLTEWEPTLLDLVIAQPTETAGVEAARLLLGQDGDELIHQALCGNAESAKKLVTALGLTGEGRVVELLLPLLSETDRAADFRIAATRAVARYAKGEQELLKLVTAGALPEDLRFTVANVLHASADERIRAQAAEHLPLPTAASAEPLPPLAELVKMQGDAERGREIFRTVGTCANCHKVHGEGKGVGPDLSEIGSKLSRQALFVSILDPSAGVSHNYETYHAVLDTGTIFSGIKLSETDLAVTLKSAEAIVRTIPRGQIEQLDKGKLSLMPADLQKAMTVEQLVDLVEYLTTLTRGAGE